MCLLFNIRHQQQLLDIEQEYAGIQAGRKISRGWIAEVKPGDSRGVNQISEGLSRLDLLTARLEKLPTSDRVAGLISDIRTAMVEDCKILLASARREQDLGGLESFLRYSEDLDVDLEQDFGVKPSELRAEALAMAKKEMAELRPRIHDGSGDAIGAAWSLLSEWSFTPKELGLTEAEVKQILDPR